MKRLWPTNSAGQFLHSLASLLLGHSIEFAHRSLHSHSQDHALLTWILPLDVVQMETFTANRLPRSALGRWQLKVSHLLPQVFASPQDTREELDTTVQALHEVCIQAMHDATDMRPRNQGLKHAPWWNDACAEHIDLIRSLTGPEKKEVQKRTRAVFRQAKREHYTTVCEAATPDTIPHPRQGGTRHTASCCPGLDHSRSGVQQGQTAPHHDLGRPCLAKALSKPTSFSCPSCACATSTSSEG